MYIKCKKVLPVLLILAVVCSGFLMANTVNAAEDVSDEMANQMGTDFLKTYYTETGGRGEFKGSFYTTGEIFEVVLDAYKHTGESKYRDIIETVYNSYVFYNGKDWLINDYNDDVMLMVIACARAYKLTGNNTYKEQATYHFDKVYERAWSEDEGGGLWWNTFNDEKNSLINGPAALAACLIGEINKDEKYFEKAKKIYDWEKNNLFDKSTGQVFDNLSLKGTYACASSYNQGTFIGAATLLYEHFGDAVYLEDAIRAADFTKNNMYNNGVINSGVVQIEDQTGDFQGFKGILLRWLNQLIVNHNQTQYIPWLQLNAKKVYDNRNSSGITHHSWDTKTSNAEAISAFSASSAVSLLMNCPKSNTVVKDAFRKIEAEDIDSIKGGIVEMCNDDGTKCIGGMKNSYYTCYRNVDFGNEGAARADFRYSSASEKGIIKICLGSPNGKIIGIADVTTTGTWQNWNNASCNVSKVTGLQDVFIVFEGVNHVANINYFQFLKGNKDAYSRIQAEDYSSWGGGIVEPCNDDGTKNLGAITNGNYSGYDNIDFGSTGANAVEFRYSCGTYGGSIELRLGSPTGTLIGTANIQHTGGWGNYKDVSCKIDRVTGVQNIYLVYKGTDYVVNLNFFRFYSNAKEAQVIQAESFEDLSAGGIEAFGSSQVIAGIPNGAYAVYKNVNLSTGSSTANFLYSCGTGDGTIEIRLKSPTGELIGTAPIQNTGGWDVYKSVSCDISRVSGVKDICLVFKGANYVLNLNYFKFPLNRKNPYYTIQAENYSHLSGGKVEDCVDGTKNIGGILNDYYARFDDLNFNSTGAKSAEFRYSCDTNGGTVEIRLGSPTGILVGTANISNTGGWGNYTTTTCSVNNVTGLQDVYFVFKGTSHVLNLNHFKFIK